MRILTGRLVVMVVFCAGLAVAGCGGGESGAKPESGPSGGNGSEAAVKPGSVGSKAAEFSLEDVEGTPVTLKREGEEIEATMLVFWATWSDACRRQISEVEKFHRVQSGKGIRVLSLSVDEGGKGVPSFVRKAGFTYTVALDRDGSVGRKYGVQEIPSVVVVDAQGVIRHNGDSVEKAAAVIADLVSGGTGGEEKKEDEEKEEDDGGAEG